MANYVLTRYQTGKKDSVELALEALETYLETVDNAKTIYGTGVELTGRDREQCVAWAIHAT